MLVLTRKRSERIRIGSDIVITVIHTSSGSVKLGIEAPSDVRVLRAELTDRPKPSSKVADEMDAEEDELLESSLSVEGFLHAFDAEFVADIEDQLLLCGAT